MKALIVTLGIVVSLVIGAMIIGLMLDREWQVQREILIEAPAQEVIAEVARVGDWPQWSAWNTETYPDLVYQTEGPETGVGAVQSWNDGAMNGRMEVTSYVPGASMGYDLSMDDGQIRMKGMFNAVRTPEGTRLSWSCWGETGSSPIDKLLMRMFLPMIGKDFEIGLANLKQRLE